MLSSEQAIVVYEGGRAHPDRLTARTHHRYLLHAERLLGVYRGGAGRTRRELHRAVDVILSDEPDCDPRRIRALSKLLDDASRFAWDPEERAADLRLRVFDLAAPHHPLVETSDGLFDTTELAAKTRIAAELGRPWAEIEAALFADFPDFQRLEAFEPGYATARDLLSRYNVAQVQACLYRAARLTIVARAAFKTILRYAKLAGLLHTIERVGIDQYKIDLTGPASVLQETRRYGVNLAKFLPALIACPDWTMAARVRTPWRTTVDLLLETADGLRSHMPPPADFDSRVEEAFARKWGDEPRDGWRLLREARVLHEGQTTFVPDFVFQHASGAEVLFEIVGFWTPEYLAAKRETLARFRSARILLAVPERHERALAGIRRERADLVVYKTRLKLEPVLEALARALERA